MVVVETVVVSNATNHRLDRLIRNINVIYIYIYI